VEYPRRFSLPFLPSAVEELPFFLTPRSGLPLRVAGAGTMQGITIFCGRARRRALFERNILQYLSIEKRAPTQPGPKRRISMAA
jgi:hypothetical protein